MPGIILTIAGWFGISAFRLVAYASIAALVAGGALTIRQHYINKGYASAIAAVKKQDTKAIGAAQAVERKAIICTNENGYWDVITQGCKLEDAP